MRKLYNFETVVFLLVLDPTVTLSLWINNQRPSTVGIRRNDTVINRQVISWESLDVPSSYLERVSQNLLKRPIRGEQTVLFFQELLPSPEKTSTIILSETGYIAQISSCKHCVTKHVFLVFIKRFDGLIPSPRFISKTDDKFFSSVELQLNLFLVTGKLIELLLCFGIVRLQTSQLGLDLPQCSFFNVKLFLNNSELSFSFTECLLLWNNNLIHFRVLVHSTGPHANRLTSF